MIAFRLSRLHALRFVLTQAAHIMLNGSAQIHILLKGDSVESLHIVTYEASPSALFLIKRRSVDMSPVLRKIFEKVESLG